MACDATSYEKTLAVMKFTKGESIYCIMYCGRKRCNAQSSELISSEKFGSLDYVFANAGSTGDEIPSDWVKEPRAPDVSVCMNMVKGVANAVHAAAPLMQHGQGKGAGVRDKAIFVSGSESAYVNFSMNPMYAMAKHTANAAAYTYAERLQPYGIRIMTIAFNFVQTKMTSVLDASDCPGGIGPHEWIPMDQCIEMFVQGLASVNQTGTVLRLSGPDQEPREMTCDFSTLGSIVSRPRCRVSRCLFFADMTLAATVGAALCQK
jgi:NAD(P)-dependent dehydrogenase (short-subunit alcohol dehydrogenase family)